MSHIITPLTKLNKFAFVILHYGDISITKRCIESINELTPSADGAIVIVDNEVNKSKDERMKTKFILEKYESVKVLFNNGKGGFSEANNYGYNYAKTVLKCNWIVIANNDTIFEQKDFIHKCIEIHRKCNNVYVISPDIIDDRTEVHQSPLDSDIRTIEEASRTYRINKWIRVHYGIVWPIVVLWYYYCPKCKKVNVIDRRENIVPMGACLVFTPNFVKAEQVAFWPETMFYYEEYILALRCKMKKYMISYEPDTKIVHRKSTITNSTFKSKKKTVEFIVKHTEQSSLIYLKYLMSKMI